MGLLDSEFWQSPQGVGLLSGIASYAANARRGTPVNNVGRGIAGGLAGYGLAQDQIRQAEQDKVQNELRALQMEQARAQLQAAKDQQAWKAGLPAAMAKTKDVQSPYEADNPFNEDLGNLQTVTQVPDMEARREYLMRPDSPYAEKLLEQQLFPQVAENNDPATVREWRYYNSLPEEQRRAYLEMKRSQQWGDFGGYRAPLLPGGKVGPAVPKTVDPGKAADIQDRRTEMDYNLPGRKPSGGSVSVTAPDGKTYTFPNQQAADKFRRAIGGQ